VDNKWQRRLRVSIIGRSVLAALTLWFALASAAVPALAVGSTAQTIDALNLPASISAPATVTVITQASSGLPLTISVVANPVNACSVSGNRVSFLALGTCVIKVDQPGDGTYAAAPTVSAQVIIDQMTTTFNGVLNTTMTILDAPFQTSVTASSGLPIAWGVITNPGTAPNCSVSSTGLITPLGVGTCTIRLDVIANANYASATTNFSLWITKANQSALSILAPSRLDPSGQVTVQVTGGSGTGAVSLATTGDCSVSSMVVTAASSGSSCTITATKAADATYNSTSSSTTISIARASSSSTPATPTPTPSATGQPGGNSTGGSGDVVFVIDEVATKLVKPSLSATDVLNSTGGKVVLVGRNLLEVEKINLDDGAEVKFVRPSDTSMTIELPKSSKVGWQSLTFRVLGSDKVFKDVVRYLKPSLVKTVSKVLKGFKPNQKTLTAWQMRTLKKFVKSVGPYKLVQCRGLSSPSYLACRYLKKVYKSGRVKVTKVSIKSTSPLAKQVRLLFSK
jgi:hypothetical protein